MALYYLSVYFQVSLVLFYILLDMNRNFGYVVDGYGYDIWEIMDLRVTRFGFPSGQIFVSIHLCCNGSPTAMWLFMTCITCISCQYMISNFWIISTFYFFLKCHSFNLRNGRFVAVPFGQLLEYQTILCHILAFICSRFNCLFTSHKTFGQSEDDFRYSTWHVTLRARLATQGIAAQRSDIFQLKKRPLSP